MSGDVADNGAAGLSGPEVAARSALTGFALDRPGRGAKSSRATIDGARRDVVDGERRKGGRFVIATRVINDNPTTRSRFRRDVHRRGVATTRARRDRRTSRRALIVEQSLLSPDVIVVECFDHAKDDRTVIRELDVEASRVVIDVT